MIFEIVAPSPTLAEEHETTKVSVSASEVRRRKRDRDAGVMRELHYSSALRDVNVRDAEKYDEGKAASLCQDIVNQEFFGNRLKDFLHGLHMHRMFFVGTEILSVGKTHDQTDIEAVIHHGALTGQRLPLGNPASCEEGSPFGVVAGCWEG